MAINKYNRGTVGVLGSTVTFALTVGILGFLGCADRHSINPEYSLRDVDIETGIQPAAGQVAVTDLQGTPISGATVLFGSSPGNPFVGNVVQTNADGIAFAPQAWRTPLSVTVSAAGFVRASYLARAPQPAVFQVRPARSPGSFELRGKATRFGRLPSDGTLDVSLIFPSIARSDVGNLELTQLIGRGVDTVNAYGFDLQLPANISVPDQSERYYLSVSVNKPNYRAYLPRAGSYRFVALHAQFDFGKTIDDLRAGKSFFDVINRMQFRSYSTRDLAIRAGTQSANLPIGENPLGNQISVEARGIPRNYAMLATAMVQDSSHCVITDVKRFLEGEKRKLVVPSQTHTGLLVRTLKKYQPSRIDFSSSDYEEASTVVTDSTNTAHPTFLPILGAIVSSGRSLLLPAPVVVAGAVSQDITVVSLSRAEVVDGGTMWLIEKTPLWDIYGDGFISKVDLPSIGTEPWAGKGRYRWELRYAGRAASASTTAMSAGPGVESAMTHFTKTAVDFSVP